MIQTSPFRVMICTVQVDYASSKFTRTHFRAVMIKKVEVLIAILFVIQIIKLNLVNANCYI